MIHTIQSDGLFVDINDKGAELCSIFSKKTHKEYLWQGDPNIWGRQAPVLFPIIGRLKDGKYTYNGKEYQMPRHGFASGMDFTVRQTEEGSLIFTCEDTKETLAMYPFSFTFHVIYTLQWNVLETIYFVVNRTDGPMYFSFGSHEGFNCPMVEGETFEDCYIEFDHVNDYKCLTNSENILLTDEKYTVIENGKRLPLNYGLFENDALIFERIPSGKLILGSNKSKEKIEVAYDNAPHLGLWTKPGAPYLCIEPWVGLPDFEDTDGDLTKKRGIIKLEKEEHFSWRHNISIYE